jgi:CRP/FNR family transcriptional regulator, cyclic AMP receptor protein
VLDLLKKVSLFANLSDDALKQISEVAIRQKYEESLHIFKEGDEADCLYVIVSGQVQIEKEFKDQRRKVLAILGHGDFFGEMAIITNGYRCASAVTVKETQLMCLQKTAFLDRLRTQAELCFEILQQVCLRLEVADTEIENLAFQNLPGRIASKIIELGKQFGVQNPDGSLRVRFELTHAKLAEMVGTNRETVSKYISMFRKEGGIAFDNKQVIILDSAKLLSWC